MTVFDRLYKSHTASSRAKSRLATDGTTTSKMTSKVPSSPHHAPIKTQMTQSPGEDFTEQTTRSEDDDDVLLARMLQDNGAK